MVVRQDLEADDCSDDANRMIVEGIHEMYSIKSPADQQATPAEKA
jgi:hypothetical protein